MTSAAGFSALDEQDAQIAQRGLAALDVPVRLIFGAPEHLGPGLATSR